MLPDRVSNPGPLTYELGALLIALRGLAIVPYLRLLLSNDYIYVCMLLFSFLILATNKVFTGHLNRKQKHKNTDNMKT